MLLDQDFEYTWNPGDFKEFSEYNSRFIVQTSSFKLLKEFYRLPEPGDDDRVVFKMPVEILRDLRAAHKINLSMTTVSDVNIWYRTQAAWVFTFWEETQSRGPDTGIM